MKKMAKILTLLLALAAAVMFIQRRVGGKSSDMTLF